ncbi:glycosyltransferase family 39 protein [Pseudomonas alvandae]|uniref:glycosyltransferase family 39 protein n=1 Tax=Pseudomonas TaxID=286 RepID=UPI0038998146
MTVISNKAGALLNKHAVLLLIVLLGAGLRSHDLFERSLWYDEVFSVSVSDPSYSLSAVFDLTVNDVHPPFYQILLWLVHKVFGFGEHVGRALSAILGVAIIPSIYMLGRRLFNEHAGLIAALLSAVNFMLVAESKEARSYSLLVLLVIWSFLAFIKMVERKNPGSIFIYAAIAAMLVNTHYFGFFPVMTHFILFVIFCARSGFNKRLFMAGAVAGLFVLGSILPLTYHVVQNFGRTGTWIPKPATDFVVNAFVLQFGDTSVVVICLFFLVLGLGALLRAEDKSDALKVVLLWCFLGFSIAYVRSVLATPILSFKNTIVFAPALIVLVSYGFSLVRDNFVRWLLLTFVCVMSVAYLFSDPDYSKLKIPHDLRAPLLKISSNKAGWPVYGGEIYSDYVRILHLPLHIESYEVLEAKLMANTITPCFYVLDDRFWPYQKHLNVELVERTSFENNFLSVFRVKGEADCKLSSTAFP